ncbi:MAG: hypothetical protein NTW50_01105 [Candidatus Berkelbacteria bacterium]|nr:hypothetical protein [Candidatus Berkelbacteria bacterium]
MKLFRNILLVVLALSLVLLDVSFFVNFEVNGATFLSSFCVLVVLALVDNSKKYYIFSLALVLFFSLFTSLPLLVIALNFFLLPAFLNFIRLKFFPEPTPFTSLFYFISISVVFEIIIMIYSGSWNSQALLALLYFVLINSAAGVFLFTMYRIIKKRFLLGEIKI